MKEALKGPKVTGVAVAVAQEVGDDNTLIYNVYIINKRSEELEKAIVTSKGYATVKKTKEKVETTTLRKMLGDIAPNSAQKIEPIMEDVMGLNNEYWLSFWIGDKMYDKKFIFLSESIKEENFVEVPILKKKGVVIGE
jgi:hypothetical protein